MMATTHNILDKPKSAPAGIASIEDFHLQPAGQTPAGTILDNDHITLYALDFVNRQAVFVETPPDLDLNQVPFYYITQYEQALRVLTLPFDTMIRLAQMVEFDPERLIFIHSVGRAGSTLASQIFAQVSGVINLSEPDTLTNLVAARTLEPANEIELKAILEATIRLHCKTTAETAWVIKGRSFAIELADWLYEIYPGTRNLFLYRDGTSWMNSAIRAYHDGVERTEAEFQAFMQHFRPMWEPLIPLLAQYDPGNILTPVGFLTLMWLSVMERYEVVSRNGIEMLAINYPSWKINPRETAVAMLEYCHCCPDDLGVIDKALATDSQAGSHLSKAAIEEKGIEMAQFDISELYLHLENHSFVKTADFVAANTLKLPKSQQD